MDPDRDINNALKDQERGRQAREVLEHPLLKEAFEALEKEILSKWKSSESVEDRERLWLVLNLLEKTQGYLRARIADGKMASEILKDYDRKGILDKMRRVLV